MSDKLDQKVLEFRKFLTGPVLSHLSSQGPSAQEFFVQLIQEAAFFAASAQTLLKIKNGLRPESEESIQRKMFESGAANLMDYLKIAQDNPFPFACRAEFATKLRELGAAIDDEGITLPEDYFVRLQQASGRAV